MSAAMNIFLLAVIREGGMPFEMKVATEGRWGIVAIELLEKE